jgi:hypothetical protein
VTTLRQVVTVLNASREGEGEGEVDAVRDPVVSTTVATGEDTPRKADVLVGEGNGLVAEKVEPVLGRSKRVKAGKVAEKSTKDSENEKAEVPSFLLGNG